MAVLLTGTTIGGHSAIHAGNLATHGIITTSNISSSALSLSGGTLTGQLNLHAGSYEGSIVFGSQSVWRTGIRQHDDGDAELRIWAKNANGMIFIATGYDGEPASISRPTDGLAIQGNKLGIGDFSAADPLYKLHVKGDIYANGGWVRVSGSEGLYFESYAGGWRMTDSTWIRAYNDKNIYTGGSIEAGGSVRADSGILDSNRRFVIPGGASTVNHPSGTGGAIRINLPTAAYGINTMMSMTVQVYEYSTGQSFTIRCGGYNYYTHDWYNVFAYLLNDSGKGADVPVYFGNNGTRDVIWIGEPGWSWTYPNVFVTDFQAGHSQSEYWKTGWSISFDTAARTNVSASRTAYRQIDTGTIGSQSVNYAASSGSTSGNAATATTLATARTLTIGATGKTFNGSANVSWTLAEIGAQAAGSYLTAESDTLATVTGRGATTASQLSFTKTDDHAISVGTIRGRAVGSQTGEFIHLYERVHIGSPSGWGAANTAAPSYGLSVYGGATIGYGNSGGLTVTGTLSATNFSGTSSGTNTGDQTTITGNAGSATVLQTARTLTIGATGKNFNGSANVSWTLAEIGAQAAGSYAAASHTHDDRYYTETEIDSQISNRLYQVSVGTFNVNDFNGTGLYRGSTGNWSNRPTVVHNGGAVLQIDTHPGNYHSQLFFDTGGDRLYLRNANAGSWGGWNTILHSGNYTSYSPSLTGSGASGTWSINVTGSAGSAPNGSNINQFYDVTAGVGNGLRFWSGSDSYKISMGVGSLYQYGPVTDYSIKAQMNDGDTGRGFTWGRISYAPIAALNSTSGDLQIAGSLRAAGHLFTSYNGNNILLRTADAGGDAGILVQNSSGSFKFQIYGNGSDYGFLNGNWAGWDIRKTISGAMYMNNDNSYYLQTNSTSNFVALNIQGNAVVHAGNIGSQSVSYATTAGSADQIDGWGFVNTGSNSATNADSINSNGISYYTGGVANFSGNSTDGALYSQRYSDSWQHQIAGDYRSGQIALRGKNSGTWQAWRTVLDSSNFSTWAQPAGSYAAASHTHDDRYYTETESDGRFLKLAGGTTTGTVVMNGDNYLNGGLSGIKNIHYQYSGIGYTVTNGAAAWYRIAKLDNFGAGILILGFTNNGSINEVIYEITYWLGEGDNATIDLRKFGVDDYVTEARIVKNNSLYYIEAYFAAAPTTPQTYHSPEIFNVRTLGTNLNKVITVYTGNLSVTSGTQTTLVTKAFIDNGNTFSVTNATNATSTLAGLAVHSGRNNEADKVVRTDVNGYIQAGWINTTSGNTTSTITDIYVNTNDGYIRKATPAHFRSQITDGVYAPVSHTHSIANVTGLQSALDGKQASGSYLTSLGFSYSTGVTANHVVQRDANGYIYANHINFSTGETENPTISSFFVSNGDGWSRKASVAHVKSQLGLGSAAYVATSTFADASHTHTFASLTSKPTTISGYGITDAITTGNIGSQSVSRASGVSITGFGTDSFTYHQTSGNVHSWTGGWASHFIGNHGNGDTYYSQSIIMPFWGVPRYQRNEAGAKVGPWQFITEENIATQSVSFATTSGSATSSTTANRLDNYGINYSTDWNSWGVNGKLVASSYHDASGANKPPTYTYGSFLSFLNAGADSFQIAIPENQFNGTGKQRAMHFRSAWNGTWSSWRQVLDIQNNTCDILADGNSTLIVRQGVGYNQPFNSNIEIHGSVDDWAYGRFRFRVQNEAGTEPVYGAQFRIERFSVNTGWQLLGMVPRGSQNLEWQGDILPGLSDQRVKENVATLTDGVAIVQQINPVEFDWKPVENVSEREGHDIGFIAQQLEEIVPTAVHTRSDGYKTVKYEKVVPILVQAIKEQQSLIEQLTARIEALENR
jgi:hypothetical protein